MGFGETSKHDLRDDTERFHLLSGNHVMWYNVVYCINVENHRLSEVQTIGGAFNHLLPTQTFRQVSMRASKAFREKLNP